MFSILWIFSRVIASLAAIPFSHLQCILIQDIRSNVVWVFIELLLMICLYIGIIPSESMYPTLHIGDASIVVRLRCLMRLERNNIIIFNPPPACYELGGGIPDSTREILVKRIVATSVSFVFIGSVVRFFSVVKLMFDILCVLV